MGIMPGPGDRALRWKKGEMPLKRQRVVTVNCVRGRREQYRKER